MSQTSESNVFTLSRARRTLPLIRPIVTDVVDCHRKLTDRLMEQKSDDSDGSTGFQKTMEGNRDRKIEEWRSNLKEYVNELYEIGAEIHHFDPVRVDFPSRLNQRVVYLCWRKGEDDVRHWHETYASCLKRREIEDRIFGTS